MSDTVPNDNAAPKHLEPSKPWISNRNYDALKWAAQILLPALATLYFALSQIWGLPKGPEVVGSVTAFDAFLGVLLGLATRQYANSGAKYDGTMDVHETDTSKLYSLNLHADPDTLSDKNEVVFKVNNG